MDQNKSFKQNIDCTVCSCAFNEDGNHCTLESICVAPCQNCSSGKADDESMCASYRCKC